MCGIAGLLHHDAGPVDPAVLGAMVGSLAHRGPDRTAHVTRGGTGVAVARLEVVAPGDAGAQPVHDGPAALAFNGEIYDRHELAAALRRERVEVDERSDTRVLFAALRQWGVTATLPRLRGMFAFAFADLERGRVWLARDRLGIKPLLWTEHGTTVAWASEAKALAPVRPLVPDPVQAIFAVTGRLERSPERTAFAGVRQVPAGHIVELQAGRPPRLSSWSEPADLVDEALSRELAASPDAEIEDRVDATLAAATRRVSDSDAPLGLFLSGGVDSSLVGALSGRDGLVSFGADVGGPRSEATAAAETARWLGLELVTVPVPHDVLVEDWALATWHTESPIVTHVNGLAFRRLAAAARARGVKAVLTGEGADELFFGYGEIATRLLAERAAAPARALRRALARLPGPAGRALARRATSQADFLVDLAGGFRHETLRARSEDAFAFLPRPEAARRATTLQWLGEHLPTLLHRNDALGMAASVEARFPYLDEDVLRLGVNLPARTKLRPSRRWGDPRHPFVTDKAILRRVASRHLPASVAFREKLGFPVYGHDCLRTTPAFWAGGYVAELLGLPDAALAHLAHDADPYVAAKAASVEVFGRVFQHGDDIEQVRDHVRRTTILA